MKDEIKEINIPNNILIALGDLTNGALNYYKTSKTIELKHKLLLDYITNLQQENKELKERLDKAIEYINDNTYEAYGTDYMDLTGIKELLNILNGGYEER